MSGSSYEPIDIVIPTRNRGELISVTVDSILKSTHDNFTLWIIDQSTNDATENVIRRHQSNDDRIEYIRHNDTGANRGRNEGVRVSKTPYVLFVDDDCRVTPNWATEMLNELKKENVWATFGRILDDETFHPEVTDDFIPVSPAIQIAVKETEEPMEFFSNRFKHDFGHGANMAVNRDYFNQIQGFDGLLGNGGELKTWDERDFGYRILRAGGKITYTPDALLYHRHWRDWPSVRRTFKAYGFGTGAAVSKYVRCGDWASLYLIVEWVLDQGVRAILSGIFKWQSMQKVQIGWLQVVQPFLGFAKGLRFPVNTDTVMFIETSR